MLILLDLMMPRSDDYEFATASEPMPDWPDPGPWSSRQTHAADSCPAQRTILRNRSGDECSLPFARYGHGLTAELTGNLSEVLRPGSIH